MPTDESTTKPHSQALKKLLQNLQPETRNIILLGAIPHWLDADVAELLFPGAAQENLETILRLHLGSEIAPGYVEYHVLDRRYLIEYWKDNDPDRFRQISGVLAKEYLRRMVASQATASINVVEWIFHTLGAEPLTGIHHTVNLFHELVESREFGPAERLARLVNEQRPWLGNQLTWLKYFEAALGFSRYEEIDSKVLEKLSEESPNTLLAACTLRLLGRIAVRQQQWATGRNYLLASIKINKQLDDLQNQALSHMDLGDLLSNLVKSSGGIMVERREFTSILHAFLYGLSRGPMLFYRFLSERIDVLPNLYGTNFQNWVALHLMRLALHNYRIAKQCYERLGNERGRIEIKIRMGQLLLTLSHPDSARQECEEALKDPQVSASPYYTARAQAVIGQSERLRTQLQAANTNLSNSLETFEIYEDWERAANTALELGETREKQGAIQQAIDAYDHCLKASKLSSNDLIESEVSRRLDMIARVPATNADTRQTAEALRQKIDRVAYIDRYPGPVQEAFHKLANWLAYPFIFLFVLVIILESGIAMQFIEGEIRFDLPPIIWSEAIGLIAGILLPVLMVWGCYLLYIILGHLIMVSLSFSKVDESQPDLYLLDEQGITQKGRLGKVIIHLDWSDIEAIYVDNRSLYRKPLAFSACILLIGSVNKLFLPASIYRYQELQGEIERKVAELPKPPRVRRKNLSVIRTTWLVVALLLGLAIAAAFVNGLFGLPQMVGCYMYEPGLNNIPVCLPGYNLYIQPVIQYGLFFTSLIFMVISLIRWQSANRWVKEALVSEPAVKPAA